MTEHNPDEFQWANTFWECFERSHKNGLLEIMRSIIRSAVSVAVAAERERIVELAEEVGAVYDTGGGYIYDPQSFAAALMDDLKRLGLRLALDEGEMQPVLDRIAAAIEAAVAEERERCAQVAAEWEPTGERNPIAGWECDKTCEGIAAAIREPKRG